MINPRRFKAGDRVIVSHKECILPVGTVTGLSQGQEWVAIQADSEEIARMWPNDSVEHLRITPQ